MQMSETFPKWKYHPTYSPCLVQSTEDERSLGQGWFDSPAEYGIETAPGVRPDKNIAKNQAKTEKADTKTGK